jgi:uncharacterized membrane protein YgaE (UPF0421/DUF939 family)
MTKALNVLILDGQGGKIGKLLTEQIKKNNLPVEITAIGTNSIATATMLKAGADYGATGENPVIYNSRFADVIIGPIGITIANSLLGEVTPAMACAVSECNAMKLLIPVNKCNNVVIGTKDVPLAEYISMAVQELDNIIKVRNHSID